MSEPPDIDRGDARLSDVCEVLPTTTPAGESHGVDTQSVAQEPDLRTGCEGGDAGVVTRPLWPHQVELVDALIAEDRAREPGRRLLIHVTTGGGKRRLFNTFAMHIVASGRRVLVVTKDWYLLGQAAADLSELNGCASHLGYVGEGGREALPRLKETARASVVYTTIQTWVSRADTDFRDQHFDYIFIDELHWGEGAPSYELMLSRCADASTFVGFTATPRKWTSFRLVGRSFGFGCLVEAGIIARPILFAPTSTGVSWSAELTSEQGDFTQASLSELALSLERNELIVATFLGRRAAFGPTIVFACNIAHADALAAMFRRRGVRAEAVHSGLPSPSEDLTRIVRDFRAGVTEVVVNVGMLTHGVDIPEIRTVFLARPTASDILFSQMIGRGARLTPGKRYFAIVDFVDNVPKLGLPPIRPEGFLGTQGLHRSPPPLEHHNFTPSSFAEVPLLPGYEDLAGLEVHPGQTFGIEFELAARSPPLNYPEVSARLLEALSRSVPTAARPCSHAKGVKDNTVWNVEPDASCGIEVTSRVLVGERGLMEVVDACRALAAAAVELDLCVNVSTGTHVHLGWKPEVGPLRSLMDVVAYYEPALLSIVAPSRAKNRYARSVRRVLGRLHPLPSIEAWAAYFRTATRYLAVNPASLFGPYGTIEVRMHSGTIEAPKILAWLALWMRILAAACDPNCRVGNPLRRVPARPLSPGPRGDLGELMAFVGVNDVGQRVLLRRREFVVKNSWARHAEYGPRARRLLATWMQAVAPPSPPE